MSKMSKEEIQNLHTEYGLPRPSSVTIIIRDKNLMFTYNFPKKQYPRNDKPPKDDAEARPRWIEIMTAYAASRGYPKADIEGLYDYWRDKGWPRDWQAGIRRAIKGGWSWFGGNKTEDF